MSNLVIALLINSLIISGIFAGQELDNNRIAEVDSTTKNASKIIYCVVALCDNATQGIVPVPAKLGNGDDADNNLYWGALYGVRSYFDRSDAWARVSRVKSFNATVVERCIFKHVDKDVYLVADAYRGSEIESAIGKVVSFGYSEQKVAFELEQEKVELKPDLVAYIGHNGLMEFTLDDDVSEMPDSANHQKHVEEPTPTIILACYSKAYFKSELKGSSAYPLLWTSGLMAPEAYTLHEALEGWINNEGDEQIRNRAAAAYHKYQRCGLRAAKRLLITGW